MANAQLVVELKCLTSNISVAASAGVVEEAGSPYLHQLKEAHLAGVGSTVGCNSLGVWGLSGDRLWWCVCRVDCGMAHLG